MSVHKTVNAAFLRVFQLLVVAAGSADEVSRQTFTVVEALGNRLGPPVGVLVLV